MWAERRRERRALALMTARDFAELGVPPALVADELSRWPARKWSAQWGEIDVARRDPRAAAGATGPDRRPTSAPLRASVLAPR